MNKAIYLVARHEFLETVRTKSFIFSLALIPALLALGLFVPGWLASSTAVTRNVVIVDMTDNGTYGDRVAQELERAYARKALASVTAHVRAYALPDYKIDQSLDAEKLPSLLLKRHNDFTDRDADAFLQNGGLTWAMTIAMPFLRPGSPPPTIEPKSIRLVDLPHNMDKAGLADDPASLLRPWLNGDRKLVISGTEERLHAAVIIPRGTNPAAPDSLGALGYGSMADSVQIWSDGPLSDSLSSRLPSAIDAAFRKDALVAAAGNPEILDHAGYRAPMLELDISAPEGREVTPADMIARALPRILSIMLIYFLYINMYMLMSNTMEEKANRIIEVLVNSITPNQLMVGKLLGSSLVALTMFSFTVVTFMAIMLLAGGSMFVEFSGVILGLLVNTPILPAMLVYFVLGYFLFAGIFLTLGAFCETAKDVQNLSTPVTLLMLVVPLVVWAFADDPSGSGARILSWLPFFGPFMMMARATSDPQVADIAGSIAVQILTIGGLLWASGKVFRIAVLFTGKAPKIGQLIRLLRTGG